MDLNLDTYEKDLLIETIEHRIENDGELIRSEGVKADLQDLIRKLEEEEY
jgi:hypothetical protein